MSLPSEAATSVHDFHLGTGAAVVDHVSRRILQLLENELVFVTCFWAPSQSQQCMRRLLETLSDHALKNDTRYRIRICLSSVSLLQKLTHTWSQRGYVYPSNRYESQLHLPPPEALPGLDIAVKSIFLLPFSVMHPKYVIIDRKTVLLPSCNVSWEDWFEGALEFRGDAAAILYETWRAFWMRDNFLAPQDIEAKSQSQLAKADPVHARIANVGLYDHLSLAIPLAAVKVLPSAYHRNPAFRPLPFWKCPRPPRTALNVHTLDTLKNAQASVFITTPNITSPPFLDAILECLKRGVNVHIITNDQLMTFEQILTAGTTTPRCVVWLAKQHQRAQRTSKAALQISDEEAQTALQLPGSLQIQYFRPLSSDAGEAVKLHLKLMIVDDETVLLGSGNQDRASWYTSQELGVSLASADAARNIKATVWARLAGRFEDADVLKSANAS